MIQKIVSAVLNWVLMSVIIPIIVYAYDLIKIKKENNDLKKKIEKLKNAKTKDEIDTAIDDIN
jgi:hypothetical protein